jgi:hypothetical protein
MHSARQVILSSGSNVPVILRLAGSPPDDSTRICRREPVSEGLMREWGEKRCVFLSGFAHYEYAHVLCLFLLSAALCRYDSEPCKSHLFLVFPHRSRVPFIGSIREASGQVGGYQPLVRSSALSRFFYSARIMADSQPVPPSIRCRYSRALPRFRVCHHSNDLPWGKLCQFSFCNRGTYAIPLLLWQLCPLE